MNLGTDLGKIKRDLFHLHMSKIFFDFLFLRTKLLLFIVSLLAFSYCVYIWYGAIYAPEWNDDQKKSYIDNKEKGVVFNESGFEDVIKDNKEREAASQKVLENRTDIFRLKVSSENKEN